MVYELSNIIFHKKLECSSTVLFLFVGIWAAVMW
jgi:hypothetical protein